MYLLVIRIVLCARVECGHNVCVMCDVLLSMLSSISTWQPWFRRSTPRLPSGPEKKITYLRKINKNNISIIHHICHQIAPISGPGQHHNKHQRAYMRRRESNKYTHTLTCAAAAAASVRLCAFERKVLIAAMASSHSDLYLSFTTHGSSTHIYWSLMSDAIHEPKTQLDTDATEHRWWLRL